MDRLDDDKPLGLRRRAGCGRKGADARRRGTQYDRGWENGEIPGQDRVQERRPPSADVARAGRGRGVARVHDGELSTEQVSVQWKKQEAMQMGRWAFASGRTSW